MEKVLGVFIEGQPKAQPRVKAARRGNFIRMYTPGIADEWKRRIIDGVHAALYAVKPLTGPVRIDATFHMPRPKYMDAKKYPDGPVWHDVKPDRDNLEKSLLDALTAAEFLSDDCIVCGGTVEKFYAARGGRTGVHLSVFTLTNADLPVGMVRMAL